MPDQNVEFEADNMNFVRPGAGGKTGNQFTGGKARGGMTGWLVAHGIVHTDNMAQIILISMVIFNFIASFIIIKYFGVI